MDNPGDIAILRQAGDWTLALRHQNDPTLRYRVDATLLSKYEYGEGVDPEQALYNVAGTVESRDAGAASERHLRELAIDQPATLFAPFAGAKSLGHLFSFERVVGRVWVYDTDLSRAQVESGHASTTRDGRLGE